MNRGISCIGIVVVFAAAILDGACSDASPAAPGTLTPIYGTVLKNGATFQEIHSAGYPNTAVASGTF
jgi:hypothetical protein